MSNSKRYINNIKYYNKYNIINICRQRFIEEYLVDGNATRAYKAAYINCDNEGTARTQGCHLLAIPNIKTCIEAIRAEIQKASMADAEEIRERLTSILRGEAEAETVVIEGVGNGYSEARRISVKPSHSDVIKSADKLLKVMGGYDSMKAGNSQAITINIAAADDGQKSTLEDLKRRKAAVETENKNLGLEEQHGNNQNCH